MDNEGSAVAEKGRASTGDSDIELKCVEEIRENHKDCETNTEHLDECMRHPTFELDRVVLENMGQLFEHCIQQVSCLERHRDELIQELLRLQEPMQRVMRHLRRRVVETQRLLTLTQLDYMAVYEDVQQVKRKLFVAARDCIQSQVTLAAREYEVAQSAVTQDELKAQIKNLTDELTQLKEAQKTQLSSLKAQATKPCRPRAMSDVSQCRQASVRLQRRLSGSVQALEGWYEPRIMALLKRKQIGEDALRKSREQAMDLKARLGPLRDDIQKLQMQRSCLEQKITHMVQEREDSIICQKAKVETLQESLRELEVEFEVQRKSKNDLEELKEGLLTELTFLRGSDNTIKAPAMEEP